MKFGLTAFCSDQSPGPAAVARLCEAANFDLLLFPDHTHIPVSRDSPYPGGGELPDEYRRLVDPLIASMDALAATSRLRVGVGVCLVPARDPIILAKQVASIDLISGGRFALGVGAGWNVEEIADHGVNTEARWAVLRERVVAMKAIWTNSEATFVGDHVAFPPMWSWPKPLQKPHPPIMVGGTGPHVLDRVIEYGDEWMAMNSPGRTSIRARLDDLARRAEIAGRTCPRVSVQIYGMPPADSAIERYITAGVDRIDFSLPHADLERTEAHMAVLGAAVLRWT